MNTSCTGRKVTVLLSTLLTLGVTASTEVFAQDQQQQPQTLEEVTVTGTRILRRDFSSQSPIVTVQADTFNERSNIGLEAALNQLPQFTVAGTQSELSPAGTPFPQAGEAPGAATINLRGLGLNRSLVLLDGRRAQPVNGQLVVDLNTIPAAAIDRVEIITGGAAAVYGADAIAGVVNFITKKDFEGIAADARYSISEQGDGAETQIDGLLGTGFADGRGNVMVGVNYSKRDIIYSRDRDWVVRGWNDPGTMGGGLGSSNLSQFDPAHASSCDFLNCGQPPFFVDNTPTAGFPLIGATYYIDQNGSVFDGSDPLNATHPYTGPLGGASGFKINPAQPSSSGVGLDPPTLGYNDAAHSYLQLPLKRYSVFGSGRIALTDHINVFSNVRFTQSFATSSGFVSSLFNVWSPTVPYNPQYDDPNSPDFGNAPPGVAQHPVPAALATLLNSRPVPDAPWTYAGGLDYIPNFRTDTTSNVYQVMGGLNGDFTTAGNHDWNWEVYGSHGNTTVNARQPEGFPFLPRVQNLFNGDQYGQNFDVSSLPGFQPIAVTGHCTSGLPIFNPDGSVNDRPSVSQDCADYMVLRMNDITTLSQDVVEANVTGGLLDMYSGTVQFAVGVDYRREHFSYDPDTGYNANQDYPSVIQNVILPVAVNGVTDVREVYGEMAIPLIRNKKFIQSFELDPGARYSDYNTIGKVTTYKLLGDWTVNGKIRFRGGFQRANRAPNVTELFTPKGGSILAFGGVADACAYYPSGTQPWGNRPENPNRLNVQTLCQYLMTREGAPASLYEPGQPSADTYAYNVFGGTFFFPASIGITEGNPNLGSESADTYTAGVVLSPLDRLTLALDWYRIELDSAIGTPTHDSIYEQCLNAAYNPLIGDAPGSHTGAELAAGNPFCDLIEREYVGGAPLTPGNYGADRKYKAQFINQGGIKTEGVDLQVDWGIGAFNWNIQASFLDKYEESPFPGGAFVDYTGTFFNSSFDYQMFQTLTYAKGPMGIGLRWQHLPQLNPSPSAAADVLPTKSHDQFDVFGSWMLGQRYQLRWGIDNLLNTDPEWINATPTDRNIGTTSSNYDNIGRRVFVGLSVEM